MQGCDLRDFCIAVVVVILGLLSFVGICYVTAAGIDYLRENRICEVKIPDKGIAFKAPQYRIFVDSGGSVTKVKLYDSIWRQKSKTYVDKNISIICEE